ncbi:MAG: FxsA family protein [Gammaproteobacteria bacterium]|nr:FxsA family protein [Gammaproteobacteria bacterium]MCY4217791.1 FxsA family protein [Gammaproteobacteria bacterium]MCY4274685.1 FxsA family protein [Gammaproteobacteria bacterium]
MKILFLLFLLIPLVEIYFLIQIGSLIGSPLTIILVVLTALIGIMLVKAQGIITLNRIQERLDSRTVPGLEIMEGFALFLAGALLLTPGFVTDAVGFICLTPALRRWIIFRLFRGISVSGNEDHQKQTRHPNGHSRVIDGEYREID